MDFCHSKFIGYELPTLLVIALFSVTLVVCHYYYGTDGIINMLSKFIVAFFILWIGLGLYNEKTLSDTTAKKAFTETQAKELAFKDTIQWVDLSKFPKIDPNFIENKKAIAKHMKTKELRPVAQLKDGFIHYYKNGDYQVFDMSYLNDGLKRSGSDLSFSEFSKLSEVEKTLEISKLDLPELADLIYSKNPLIFKDELSFFYNSEGTLFAVELQRNNIRCKYMAPEGKLSMVLVEDNESGEVFTFLSEASLSSHWVDGKCHYSNGSPCSSKNVLTIK
ncbi:MAG: hypothetical protein K2X66_10400 [Cyanobacteria bacterium]|nr:hypothetical protein [Cyanobacteriota bacterium]